MTSETDFLSGGFTLKLSNKTSSENIVFLAASIIVSGVISNLDLVILLIFGYNL